MGAYLSAPNTEKISSDESHDHLEWGVSGMQGWRISMEDAHCCFPDLDGKNNSMFGVFDGHGGREVAQYCAKSLHKFVLDTDAYREGDIKGSLRQAFLAIDEAILSDEVIEELKGMLGGESDHGGDEDEDEAALLLEEANMPIEQLIERFKGNVKEHLIQNGILELNEEEHQWQGEEEEKKKDKKKSIENGHKDIDDDEKAATNASQGGSKKTKLLNGDSSSSSTTIEKNADVNVNNAESSSLGKSSSKNEHNSDTKENTKDDESSDKAAASESDDEDEEETEEDSDGGEEVESDDDDESEEEDGEFEDSEGMEFQQGSDEVGKDSGTTAIVALLHEKTLYVANAGDSRCVLCRNGKAVEMSFDHKPEDEIERRRIENAGGKITSEGRVMGGLNLSRAIGDHTYKKNKELPLEEQMITSSPDIKDIKITEDDSYMVLACDGIWNVMTNEEVIEYINDKLKSDKKLSLSKICEELFDNCIAPNTQNDGTGCDNMTCMIVRFKQNGGSDVSVTSGKSTKRTLNSDNDRKSKKTKLNDMD